MDSKKINIELSKNEALVLFDFLARFNKIDTKNIFEDQAEQRVLWDIECALEKQIPDLFSSNYKLLLSNARINVRD